MANVSDIKQEIQNNFDTKVQTDFDINMQKNCIQSTDASQIIEGVKLQGVSDIDIQQVNKSNNSCALKTLLDMDVVSKLTETAQGNLLDKLNSTTGMGVSVVNKDQKIINNIKNEIGLSAAIDLTTKCLQQTLQTQTLKNISIQDARKVNFSQMNEGLSTCLSEGESALKQKTEKKTETKSEVVSETIQKGFDPLAALGNIMGGLGMMGAMMASSPIIICCVCVLAIAMIMMGGKAVSGDASPTVASAAETVVDTGGLGSDASMLGQSSGGSKNIGGCTQYGGVSAQILGRSGLLMQALGNWLAGK